MGSQDIRKKPVSARVHRGSQVIFGERRHLEEVLRSVEGAGLPGARKRREIRHLRQLIRARTEELNQINPAWDRKFRKAQDPKTDSRELLRLAAALPQDDYLLARALTEHPEAPGELLERLATHPYPAVRENVARHPNTPISVLRRLSEDPSEPLWFLVACNPSAPASLRQQLRERIEQIAEK